MAVKTLKKNLKKFFLTLINQKLISLNCKSVSVMTGALAFLLSQKIIWLAVLSSYYWLYDFNVTRFQKNCKQFVYFLLLVPFENLS